MPVIDNLKNFIRHGKAARDQDNNSNNNTSPRSQAQVHPAEVSGQSHAPIGSGVPSSQQVGYIPDRSTGSQPQPSNTTAKGHASQQQPSSSSSAQQAASAAAAAAAASANQSSTSTTNNQNMNSSSNKKSKDEYTQEAQQIVNEEREASEKMPYHEGLSERYELISKMGDGAFSNVYKARDRKTGALVAVKVVRKYELNSTQNADGRLDPQFRKKNRVTERANILKEVQIMRNLKHDGIVELLEFSESREYYFLVLELLKGGELFHQIVKLTYFSEPLSRHVILQVANGIRYLHEERGVVHRDIKPENLLFESIKIIPSKYPKARPYDEEKEDEGEFMPGIGGGGIGKVKIADFGLSKVVWEESTMTPCGTVGYTAPEIVKDERYSKSVDMWALGCVLYTLLCGFPPFYDESISVLTEKVAKGYYTFLSPWWDDISDSAKDLITHLLCVDSSKRYTIDEFLAHPWCNVRDPVPDLNSAEILLAKTSEMPLDSPLLQSMKRGDAPSRQAMMSPGIHQLKEAFDVTYAVHRMEEEGRHRQKNPGNSQALGGLNEEEEEDEADVTRRKYGEEAGNAVEQSKRSSRSSQSQSQQKAQPQQQQPQQQQQQQQQQYQGRGGADRKLAEAALYEGRAGTRDRGSNSASKKRAFELNMGNATLLGRRNKGGGAMGGLQPNSIDATVSNSLGSPMRVD